MDECISYSVDADGIALLSIDVPGRPMNVLTEEFFDELPKCIDRIVQDGSVKGAIITSMKKDFMAGADLKSLVEVCDRGMTPDQVYEWERPFSRDLRRMETCGKPIAAAINGTALGGGLELALACHYRVLADSPKTVVGLPEVTLGLLPGAGGTQRLLRLIGIERALPLLLEGRTMGPGDALKHGFFDTVVSPGELLPTARNWVLAQHGKAQQPWDVKGYRVPGGSSVLARDAEPFMLASAQVAAATHHNYPAPRAILSCVYEGSRVPMDTALRIEFRYFASLLIDPVARNMIRTLFISKGAADKLNRRPQGVARSQVRKLGVLGAGMMGAGICYVSARAGIDVTLLDSSVELAEKGKDYSRKLLDKQIGRGQISQKKADAILDSIACTQDYDDLAEVDLVIEAVFEDREVKADVTGKAEAVIGEQVVFGSNTSTLPITGLARASRRPENFIGVHFFSPVDKMALVEIIVGQNTSDETIARCLDYVAQLRKTPIVVNDSRGFYTSRVFTTFTNEGLTMLADGVSPALIENVAVQAGLPVGPLALIDEITIELSYKVTRQRELDEGEAFVPRSGDPVINHFYNELERWGKRYGKGFYDYPEGESKRLWPGLKEMYPPVAQQPSPQEVRKRFLYIQALESARCFEEGVVISAAEADVGSCMGWAFPSYTGGTLSFIDTVGIRAFVDECDRMAGDYGDRFAVSDWLREKAGRGEGFYPDVGK